MTQENKQLLLVDLCARLPYKTKIQLTEYSDLTGEKLPSKIKTLDYCMLGRAQAYCKGFRKDEIKPLLFPMSSMTKEQSKIYHELIGGMFGTSVLINFEILEDFFHKNHLDYRGLIPMGLAIDATDKNIY